MRLQGKIVLLFGADPTEPGYILVDDIRLAEYVRTQAAQRQTNTRIELGEGTISIALEAPKAPAELPGQKHLFEKGNRDVERACERDGG